MPDSDDVTRMTANVAKSREHIVRQHAIIARLKAQGHYDAAADAERLLDAMQGHLTIEQGLLVRYETEAAERAKFR